MVKTYPMSLRNIVQLLIPFGKGYFDFGDSTILPDTYWGYLLFRLGLAKTYWPKAKTCLVANPRNIFVGINSKIGRPGAYIQGLGGVYIGNYVRFGPNVGILSANHDLYNRDSYNTKSIKIGDYCWIGMNALITAGVELGPSTIVGGGSVVTKSFPEGYCVIAGNPAKVIKYLDKEKVIYPKHKRKYYGYIPEEKFEKVKSKYIDI